MKHPGCFPDFVANSADPDQTARMQRPIWVYAVRKRPKVHFHVLRLICYYQNMNVWFHTTFGVMFIFKIHYTAKKKEEEKKKKKKKKKTGPSGIRTHDPKVT